MEKSLVSDGALVSLYQNGNEKAFEILVKRHKSKVYTAIYLINFVGNEYSKRACGPATKPIH